MNHIISNENNIETEIQNKIKYEEIKFDSIKYNKKPNVVFYKVLVPLMDNCYCWFVPIGL